MVKYESLSHIFNYTWDHVVSCYWKKYPNEHSTHVLSEDVIDRRILDGNKLYTKRILGKTNPLPKWGTTIFPSHMTKIAHVLEESVVDLHNQSMVCYTWNISYRTLIDLKEKLSLRPNFESTECLREGWAESSATGFRRVLRSFGITRWKSNAQKAFAGFEKTLVQFDSGNNVLDENIAEGKVMTIPRLRENTLETIKDAKDKAKNKAIDLATLAAAKKPKAEAQNL